MYIEETTGNNGEVTDEGMNEYVKMKENQARLWNASKMDEKNIRHLIYEKGLSGMKETDLLEELYNDLNFTESDIAMKDKLHVSPLSDINILVDIKYSARSATW